MGIASKFSDKFNKTRKAFEEKVSENVDQNTSKGDESNDGNVENSNKESLLDAKTLFNQLEEARKNYAALEAKYDFVLRASAEKDNNLKNVVERNKTDIQFTKDDYAKKFIASIATEFEILFRVVDSIKENPSPANIESLDNLMKKFSSAFDKVGVSFVYPNTGEEANPDMHNIVGQTAASGFKKGQIVNAVSACWKIRDRVIKFADVIAAIGQEDN